MALGCLPLIQGIHMAQDWWSERAGKTPLEQLATYDRSWCRPELVAIAAEIERLMPPDEPLLMTPIGGDDRTGRTRYHLFLANRLHPRPVYVRQPNWGSGTLVDYHRWLDYHFQLLDTAESGPVPQAEKRRTRKAAKIEEQQRKYGITWELRFHLDLEHPFAEAELLHMGQPVELRLPGASATDAAPTDATAPEESRP